jgi:predicted Rossmann fold nucleotide-binding protein DprA/Smf involved in DNA uptake
MIRLGYDAEMAERICKLLSRTEQLQWYAELGRKLECYPITRVSLLYPQRLRHCLAAEAPGVLWVKGDPEFLQRPAIALVGSRDLNAENMAFARQVGAEAARQGYVLVSGNARGADRAAQDSCLEQGGCVISVVSDRLDKCPAQERVLYVAEEGYDLEFSPARALQRNRVIHCLGSKTFVAQCALGKGGTWSGTVKNLRAGWSPVFCFRDSSAASRELKQMGATLIDLPALQCIDLLSPATQSFLG